MGAAARAIVGDLASVVTAQGKVNFSAQLDQVRAFEAASARMAVATGQGLESIRAHAEQVGQSIGARPREVIAWADSVGRLTYNFKGAMDSQRAFAELAAMTGRSVDDYRGVATQLGQVGVTGANAAKVVGNIVAQSDQLKNVGGPAALIDRFESMGDAVTMFADRSNVGIGRVVALLGVLGKGMDEVSARRVGQQALGALSSDPRRWERFLGHHVLNEHGQIGYTDAHGNTRGPADLMQEIYNKASKRYGGNQEQLRNVLINNFGAELGSQMLYAGKHGDFGKIDALSHLGASGKPGAALATSMATDAGKRASAEAQLEVSSRQLLGSATKLGQAADAMQRMAAAHPVATNAATAAAGAAAGTFFGALGKIIPAALKGASVATGAATTGITLGGAALVAGAGAGGAAIGHYGIDYHGHASDLLARGLNSANQTTADMQNADYRAMLARQTAGRGDRVSALERGGLSRGQALFVADHEKDAAGSATRAQVDAITTAVAAGIKAGMKDVKIVTRQDTPIEVTASGGAHPAAGNQGGG